MVSFEVSVLAAIVGVWETEGFAPETPPFEGFLDSAEGGSSDGRLVVGEAEAEARRSGDSVEERAAVFG
jgi:hypothetical protein